MKTTVLILFPILFISSLTYGQSSFLRKGENGIGLSAGYFSTEEYTTAVNSVVSTGFSGSAGYSFSGIFDLGLSVINNETTPSIGSTTNYNAVAPYASLLVIKQDRLIPLSLSLDASYERINYYNLEETALAKAWENNLFFGASIFTDILSTTTITLQPTIKYAYMIHNLNAESRIPDVKAMPSQDKTHIFQLGLSLVLHAPKTTFALTPSLRFREKIKTYGLNLSLILPQN